MKKQKGSLSRLLGYLWRGYKWRLLVVLFCIFISTLAVSYTHLDVYKRQGTRSIVAFAEKYQAVYRFQVVDGWFRLRLAL